MALYSINNVPICTTSLGFYTNGANQSFNNNAMIVAPTHTNDDGNDIYYISLPFAVKVYAISVSNDRDSTSDDNNLDATFQVVTTNVGDADNEGTPVDEGTTAVFNNIDWGYRHHINFSTQPNIAANKSIGLRITTSEIAHNEISAWLWCYQV